MVISRPLSHSSEYGMKLHLICIKLDLISSKISMGGGQGPSKTVTWSVGYTICPYNIAY